MKTIKLIFTFVLIWTISNGQTAIKDFQKFASIQDSLCVQAYEKRDDKHYEKLLKEFENKYNKLPDSTKNNFSSQLTNLYYNFCCLYSLQNNKSQALTYFEKCVKRGYNNYLHTTEDTDLDNIRNESRYKSLISQVRSVGDYLYILRRAEKYNPADSRLFPQFSYQSSDNPNLVQLRKHFKLDSIAGTGNEISQILNLLHWIHNLIPHDGQHENPVIKNAMDMIAVCKKDDRGLNCRGLSTVLNECYLSLGFKSRFLTCMPKDSLQVDQDCHVINMVYSTTLKKWLWVDPTNDAYVMNENGELLSVEEVRERLINNKPLILNPDANWNRKESVIKDYYLNQYMAKNLYKFSCPVNSEYDTETSSTGKKIVYVELLPLDYYKQQPDKEEETSKKTGTTHITYKTNNPSLFWQTP